MKRRRIKWVWEDPDAARAFEEWVGFPDAAATVREIDQILSSTEISPPVSVLDVGCGTGRHSLELARRGCRVVGIDVSEHFINSAQEQAAAQAVEVDFRLLRASDIEYSAEFDIAIAWNHTLGFMSDSELRRGFTRIKRALKPKGVFLLVLAGPKLTRQWPPDNERSWTERETRLILTDKRYENNYRFERTIIIDTLRDQFIEFEERQRALSLREVQTLLRDAGFAAVKSVSTLAGDRAEEDHFGVFICHPV